MEVLIESPAYMRLKAEVQPRENVHSTAFFLDRGLVLGETCSVNLNIKVHVKVRDKRILAKARKTNLLRISERLHTNEMLHLLRLSSLLT